METLVESIRNAVAADATAEARGVGADACRTILAALGATPVEPLAAVAAPTSPPIATIVSALRGLPLEQLLDLAIARVRAALPADTALEPVQSLKILRVPLPGAKP
jgi:hypothetical protein